MKETKRLPARVLVLMPERRMSENFQPHTHGDAQADDFCVKFGLRDIPYCGFAGSDAVKHDYLDDGGGRHGQGHSCPPM
ncbi:MAG: hypothetical protein R2875_12210 [Desulfobacterales bacterium]